MPAPLLNEHPFAPFVRILGKGKRGARPLTREEAAIAMGMILDGEVEETQLGAFLMLLRHKEESAEELAGFTDAVRARLPTPNTQLDLDWPCYAGKKRHLPWHLLAAKALAASGRRILLHGGGAHTAGRLYVEAVLEPLGIPVVHTHEAAQAQLTVGGICFFPLVAWMPVLQRLIDLRNVLGLRSPIHSLARLLNPLGATCSLQSIFHPGYQAIHRDAAALLGDRALVIKGEGGEFEVNPDSDTLLYGAGTEGIWEERWAALAAQRHVKPDTLEPDELLAVWHGQRKDTYASLAIQGTMAVALRALGMPQAAALEEAQRLWTHRSS